MEEQLVSIIIPAHNALSCLRDCLKSIRELNYKNFEIIVVKDGGKEDLKPLCREMNARLIELKKNSGPGAARNKGAEHAKGDLIAFVDSDCIVPPAWLTTLVNRLRDIEIGAVTGYYNDTALKNFIGYFQLYETLYRIKDIPPYVNNLASSNLAVKRNVFEETGGFGSQRVNEDMELGYWISKKYKIYWDKNNGITHLFRNSISKYLKQQFYYASSVVESIFRYPEMYSSASDFGKTNTILLDISSTMLTIISLIPAILNIKLFPITVLCYILWFLTKFFALKFCYAKKKNIKFVFMAGMFYYLRDISWILGLTRGTIIGICNRWILRKIPQRPEGFKK